MGVRGVQFAIAFSIAANHTRNWRVGGKRTVSSSFGQVSDCPSIHRPAGFRAVYPVAAMNRCIPRSTAAGFPAKGSFLAAALSPHPSSLAIPALKAASASDCGLDRCGMFFRIFFGPLVQYGQLAHGAASFWSGGAPITERPLPRVNLFLNPSQKASRGKPLDGRRQARLWRMRIWTWTEAHARRPVSGASAAAFRIAFGLLCLAATVRFAANGWIADLLLCKHLVI